MNYERKLRWRYSRETLPAKRRRRQSRRRHTKRDENYIANIDEETQAVAVYGIRRQLRLGTISIATAVVCIILGLLSTKFAILAFLSLGFLSLSIGLGLIASASREEKIHRLSFDLPGQEHLISLEDSYFSGEDGSI